MGKEIRTKKQFPGKLTLLWINCVNCLAIFTQTFVLLNRLVNQSISSLRIRRFILVVEFKIKYQYLI